jgi:hypothetical protein
MTTTHPPFNPAALKTPRAAAIAGILFALLDGASLILIRLSVPPDVAAEGAWLATNGARVALALNMAPFAGIAFLWFIGVIRDRVGDLEDRFFSSVFFGSGLLFLALVLLLSIGYTLWVTLVFPAWVLAVSATFLITEKRS